MKTTARAKLLIRLLAITELMVRCESRIHSQIMTRSEWIKRQNTGYSDSELYAEIAALEAQRKHYLPRLNKSYLNFLNRLNELEK